MHKTLLAVVFAGSVAGGHADGNVDSLATNGLIYYDLFMGTYWCDILNIHEKLRYPEIWLPQYHSYSFHPKAPEKLRTSNPLPPEVQIGVPDLKFKVRSIQQPICGPHVSCPTLPLMTN